MTFTKEQMEMLSPYEEHFTTALKANWSRHPSREGLRTIFKVYTDATGDTRRLNENCSTCILTLIRDCGLVYFFTKYKNREKVEPVIVKILVKYHPNEVVMITETEQDGKRVIRKETRERGKKAKVS